jgi:hypothetical protein
VKWIVTYREDYTRPVACPDGDPLCTKNHVMYLTRELKRIFQSQTNADAFMDYHRGVLMRLDCSDQPYDLIGGVE